ncbi:sensor histidine kinase [Spirillospora sp. NPDC050679]
MRGIKAVLTGCGPPGPLHRFFAAIGVAWGLLAFALAPGPVARAVLVLAFIALWVAQLVRMWVPPARWVPFLALAILLLPLFTPPAESGLAAFRPFPQAEGSYADGALAVATAPVWFTLALLGRGRDLAWCVPVALALAPARHLLFGGLPLWPTWLVWGVGFLLFGAAFRLHALLYEARLRLDRESVAEERRKIAREVHDLVGHGLGVALLNIGAARLAIGRGDAEAATAALEEAERAGRRSARDVHRGLILLREPGQGSGTGVVPALPTAEDTRALVAGLRAGGLDVELTTRGDLAAVDPAVGLAIFRVVQEALSNTARHAPGAPAAVTVEVDGRLAEVTVADPGPAGPDEPAPGGGLGLVGMRERVAALGGTLRAGPAGAGWSVRATIPLGRAAL